MIYRFEEHTEVLTDKDHFYEYVHNEKLHLHCDKSDPHKYLGIDWDSQTKKFKAGYYVGVDWIDNDHGLLVEPKIPGLNYLEMFLACFESNNPIVRRKLKDVYHISFDKKNIQVPTNRLSLTPILIIHFLKSVEKLVEKGLKHDYRRVTENLNAKIKGKIDVNQTIKYNYSQSRTDRHYCNFQIYTADCIENRVIKKALVFVKKYLGFNPSISCNATLTKIAIKCLSAFTDVSDDMSVYELRQFHVNPMFKEYAEALKIAKRILKRFGYSIRNVNSNCDMNVPPFYIDMSLLFELYVLELLKRKYRDLIGYHLTTYGNEIDFAKYDENLIIDAKYIPNWDNQDNHNNIRQLSGYARNVSLRRKILREDDTTTILPCLIIYPSRNNAKTFGDRLLENAEPVSEYLKFHKLGIQLPIYKIHIEP